MKQFDDIFSRKAKEAFDSYNADHLAGEGWNSYLSKYGHKRRRAFIVPLWAKAASILVLVTIGVLFTNRSDQRKTGDSGNQLTQENRSELKGPTVNEQKTTAENPVFAIAGKASEITAGKAGQAQDSSSGTAEPEVVEIAGSVIADAAYTNERPSGIILHDLPLDVRLVDNASLLSLSGLETLPVLGDMPREKMTTTIMTGLSGMLASIDNTTSTARGVSAGLYVERQLTRRISIRPGLAMAKHNYAMESASGGSADFNYAAPALDGLSGTTTSYEADMEVLTMEVPVNFVFSIRKRAGSNLFVTTGASTMIYLNQHMSGSFNNTYTRTTVDSYGEVSYESMTTSVRIERDQELLTRVDLLGLANFSAGYSLPFGKTSHLLFEPFIQLPIRDLTSLNLRIRYGGLSMKIQF